MSIPSEIIDSGIDLPKKILDKGGVVGLLAVMGFLFLFYVVYQGIQQMNTSISKLSDLSSQQITALGQANQTLSDIRYTLDAGKGITFRNNATTNP